MNKYVLIKLNSSKYLGNIHINENEHVMLIIQKLNFWLHLPCYEGSLVKTKKTRVSLSLLLKLKQILPKPCT